MSPAIWLCIFLPLLIVLLQLRRQRDAAVINKIRRGKGGKKAMLEMLQGFIGKDCLIYTIGSTSQSAGIIRAVKDNWVEVEAKGLVEVINADFIVRVREFPRTKSGKKKSVVLD